MPVAISSELTERIVALAAAEPAREVCGLLVGTGAYVTGIVVADNVADDPHKRFEVDPAVHFAAIRAARGGGHGVIGCYHSHPSGSTSPSECDRAMIGQTGELWLITDGRTVRAWQADTPTSFIEVDFADAPSGCVTS